MPGFNDGIMEGANSAVAAVLGHSSNQEMVAAANADRQFQRDIAHHGVEWKVEDLKRAGLNPMLAYMNASGGAHASGGGNIPSLRNVGEAAVGARVSSAQAAALSADIDLKRSQAELNRATIPKLGADIVESGSRTDVNRAMVDKVLADTKHSYASASQVSASRELIYTQIDEVSAKILEINSATALNKERLNSESASQVANLASAGLSRVHGMERMGMMKALWELATNDAYRSKLSLPHAENMANAEFSTWKRVFAPYMNDLQAIATVTGAGWFLQRLSQPAKQASTIQVVVPPKK